MPNTKKFLPKWQNSQQESCSLPEVRKTRKRWNAAKKRKKGHYCNNSCLLLRNTECFPAIWINKHSLVPLGPRLRVSPIGRVRQRHQPRCPPATCFQLTVMKQEITANLTFLALRRAAFCPKLLSNISSGIRVSVHVGKTDDMDSCKMLFTHNYYLWLTAAHHRSWWWLKHLDFLCLDHPEEITIEPREAIEGDDVTLTCRAARYLYTDLQWLDSRNQIITSNVSSLQLSTYSISLSLHLHNVSQTSDTGYKCQAFKLHKRVEPKTAGFIVDGEFDQVVSWYT